MYADITGGVMEKNKSIKTNKGFAYGVDLGWMSQLEDMGYYWSDENGERKDILKILKNFGVDSIRFRLFVDPPKEGFWVKTETEKCMLGYCDTKSVLQVAKRVTDEGFRLMLDFHYSDLFADPQYQQIPKAWLGKDADELATEVTKYTESVLTQFKDNGIFPEWVQVGNEINPGMLLPVGDSQTAMPDLVKILNAGYDAVKKIYPEAIVITHLANAGIIEWITAWFDSFFAEGGKTDVIGLSHYPYWYKMLEGVTLRDLGESMNLYYEKYGKPIMITEVGEDENEPKLCYDLLKKTIDDLRSIPDESGIGLFYWEPEIGKDVLPDKYPLGAANLIGDKEIRFNYALTAYKHL